MAAFFALLSGKAALAAKLKFKTYPERFDYEKGFAAYYEKNIRPVADSFERERINAPAWNSRLSAPRCRKKVPITDFPRRVSTAHYRKRLSIF